MEKGYRSSSNMQGGQSSQSWSLAPQIPGFTCTIKRAYDSDSDDDYDDSRPQKKSKVTETQPDLSEDFEESDFSEDSEGETPEMVLLELDWKFYTSILANLCPDNMRGLSCRTPDACMKVGFYFACPEYSLARTCKYGELKPISLLTKTYTRKYTHPGYKHTITGCDKDNEVDCKKIHEDGRPCRVEVTYWHVRAACAEMRGTGEKCEHHRVKCGHDNERIRKHVMTARRSMK